MPSRSAYSSLIKRLVAPQSSNAAVDFSSHVSVVRSWTSSLSERFPGVEARWYSLGNVFSHFRRLVQGSVGFLCTTGSSGMSGESSMYSSISRHAKRLLLGSRGVLLIRCLSENPPDFSPSLSPLVRPLSPWCLLLWLLLATSLLFHPWTCTGCRSVSRSLLPNVQVFRISYRHPELLPLFLGGWLPWEWGSAELASESRLRGRAMGSRTFLQWAWGLSSVVRGIGRLSSGFPLLGVPRNTRLQDHCLQAFR